MHPPDRGTTRPPTLEDVARLAGVSLMTASRAVNGAPYVSERSRQKVHEAQEALGFVAHRGARHLVTRRTDAVALVVPVAERDLLRDTNVAAITSGAGRTLAGTGRQLVTLLASTERERQQVLADVKGRSVDAVLVVAPELLDDLPRRMEATGMPVVATGDPATVRALGRGVVVDVEASVAALVAVLVEGGARRPALVAGPEESSLTATQVAAFAAAVAPLGVPVRVVHGDWSSAGGEVATAALLAEDDRVDGLAVLSDTMAAGALRALRRHGLRVPQDVRVVGHDDSAAALHTDPVLTTLRVPFVEIGARLAELAVAALDGAPPRVDVLATAIVRRGSA
ncbi:LacI family DNA-binding transcriptional regulator [Cellulomonas endophytica]|uniref:LacI family DNA-binding transcriptional regulator n=1 Tax=Cellulomonas endophytica TaxID=2494735 RepID=UPI001011AB64|nr:LacI family DNA-binding transcriptional regulator [Cellulomonas endophytica]